MVTAIIIQARAGSTRLPGKVLKRLAGRTVLEHVVTRARAVQGIDVVGCAIPVGSEDDEVVAEASRLGAHVTRGAEHDVLGRYHDAAVAIGARTVMRITSDCPLIDPIVCSRTLELHRAADADYTCNIMPRTWPRGLDCEVFRADRLAEAATAASSPEDREHVTPWLRNHPELIKRNLESAEPDLAKLRWTLDYPEDLNFFRALFALLPSTLPIQPFEDLLRIVRDHPWVCKINANCAG